MRWMRIIAMTFLLTAGFFSLVYGAFWHGVMIDVKKERDVSVAVPAMPPPGGMPGESPDGAMGMPLPGANRTSGPEAPPGMKFKTVTEEYVEPMLVSEMTVVQDVTIGGLTLQADGHLVRTYTGTPPSLCPT